MGLFSYAKALEKMAHSNEKVTHSNEKVTHSNEKMAHSNEKVTHSNEKVTEQRFYPRVPKDLNQTGLHEKLIEDLIFKLLHSRGVMTGRLISDEICLPFKIIEKVLLSLKKQMLLAYRSDSGTNDFVYMLTEQGRTKALIAVETSAYVGSAPVPYAEYLGSFESQSIQREKPGFEELQNAFHDLVMEPHILDTLGPAINSGRGVFLYGAPGNGKTSIAKRIHKCFTDFIYIPKTLLISGQLLKFYDLQWHKAVAVENNAKAPQYDKRWIKIERPSIVVGGEMDLESLEIKYNPVTKISEAPLQMKANCGTFVVDDFGRQRVSPIDLLNRWILPLEKRIDFLTLSNGIKFQVPFDELLIFCTIMEFMAPKYDIEYDEAIVTYLIDHYFRGIRPFRNCHPRDILEQIVNTSAYQRIQPRLTENLLKIAANNYFVAVSYDDIKK